MASRRGRLGTIGTVVLLSFSSAAGVFANDTTYDLGGRIRPQFIFTCYPDNSFFRGVYGSRTEDLNLDARMVLEVEAGSWSFDVDYQLIALYGDRVEFSRELPEELRLLYPRLPTDRARLFDLTWVHHESGRIAVLSRLDRLSVGYSTDKVVLKFGRQAISWGNGLVYNAMDIFNPFDPAAVDKEYKTGDDMVYGQFLRDNGDDLQGVAVFRRDVEMGDIEADASSLALKYHGMLGAGEYDVLVSRHFGDNLVGAGGNRSLGGAVWQGDLVVTLTDDDAIPSLVTNLTYSWVWGGKNFSGGAEYFYNGFGQGDGCYSLECLAENPELLSRIGRGELFTLGRHYVALNALIEVHPLFKVTPIFFTNVSDPSALFQALLQYDPSESLVLVGSVNIPMGADGTEFGGLSTDVPGLYLSSGLSVIVQLGWYW